MPGAPHIVTLMVDDLGWHNVGWHNPRQRSPNIDRLVREEGAELTRHYAYKVCSPSRSSFLSGRLPIHVNVENLPNITSPGGIDLRMTLLPQMLRRAGYETAVGLECAPQTLVHSRSSWPFICVPICDSKFDSHSLAT
jgi:arylsulfatase A-like enzyme